MQIFCKRSKKARETKAKTHENTQQVDKNFFYYFSIFIQNKKKKTDKMPKHSIQDMY
jgi:hypothetical protein